MSERLAKYMIFFEKKAYQIFCSIPNSLIIWNKPYIIKFNVYRIKIGQFLCLHFNIKCTYTSIQTEWTKSRSFDFSRSWQNKTHKLHVLTSHTCTWWSDHVTNTFQNTSSLSSKAFNWCPKKLKVLICEFCLVSF